MSHLADKGNFKFKDWSTDQAYMGDKLGISQVAFGRRLRMGKFDNVQLYVIFKELEATEHEILRLMTL